MLFWPVKLAFRIVSLLLTAIVVYLVVSGVQVVRASQIPTGTAGLKPAAAIVLVASGVEQGSPGPGLVGRLEEARSCYQAHLAPRIVLGGAPSDNAVAASWLGADGVPASAVQSLPAAGNAAAALSQLAKVGTQQVIVVTDALAAYWTRAVASHDGMTAEIAPATGSKRDFYKELGPLFTQASAVSVGRIVGFSRASWAGH